MEMAQSHTRRQQPCVSAVLLAVLVLAVAVAEATDTQLPQLPHIKPPNLPNLPNLSWEKLPFVGRFSKAAQAAKAAAAAITVSHALPKTPSLPPTPPVAGLALPPAAAGSPAVNLIKPDSSKLKAGGGKKGKELKQLPTTGKNETQAGCSCLTDWENKPGGSKMNGCQNPDNDPLGTWCQVDPAQCQGYYSMYRTEKGKLKFYDYCVPVRERTKKGCLCSSDWAPAEGQVGKSHYRDACARPHADKGPRVCKVDSATCPPGVDPAIEFDECKDIKQEQMVLPQDKTWHNCGCVTGWSYKYDDGTSAIFSTCANPDADPLGHWCQVDPNKCDNFATILKNGDQTMSIDYCGSKYKGAQQGCKTRLKVYDQCGGKSNCTQSAAGCVNAPWPGACCPRGSECRMQDAFYYQCLPLDADQAARSYKTAPVGGFAGEVVVTPKKPTTQLPPVPAKAPKSPATAAAEAKQEIASSSLDDNNEPQGIINLTDDEDEDGDPSKEAGQRLWVKLRLSMDYDLLVVQPLRVAQFKHDVAHFLREVVGDTKFVYGTGVDEVLAGSVVAVSYIDFTKNAPNQAVDAAMEQLHTNGRDMFADSGLPSKYGWLLSYNMGQSKADMIADDKGEVQIQAMNFPAAGPAKAKSHSKLSLTITIAIAVGGLLMVLAIMCAVMAMRHRRARRQQNKQQQMRAKKPAPKVLGDKMGGVDGTTSGYLADLDGMLDDDNSDKIKSSTGKSHSHTIPDSRVAGVGMRGPLSSKATLNLHGSNTSTSASKHTVSEAGGTVQSRLWHWLQRAEPPACHSVDTQLEGQPTNSPLSSPEVSCNISAALRPKDSPRRNGILPHTPRNGVSAGAAGTLDLSEPGGSVNTFRVPPPSPRYTDRAAIQADAAAAERAAMRQHSSNNGLMMSPRPAPAGAALLSGSTVSRISGMHAGADGRSRSTNRHSHHAPASTGMMSPRPASHSSTTSAAAAAAAAAAYDHGGARSSNTYNLLDTIVGGSSPCPSSFNGMSDYGGGGGMGAAAGGGGGGYGGTCMAGDGHRQGSLATSRSPSNYNISTIHPTPRVPADSSGDLPPGISMGPFLRAAIKSLTGQSLGGRSGFGSDGGNINSSSSANPGGPGPASSNYGNPAAAAAAAGGMYGSPQHSPGRGGMSSPVPPPHHQGGSSNGYGGSSRDRTDRDPYGGSDSYLPAGGSNGASRQQGHAGRGNSGGAGAMAAAVRASAQAQAEQDAAEDPGMGAGSGSVFQSLWMQRLVAAAQAQQAELLPPGRANVRLEDAHMYGQPRR